ncbi:MAG: RNA polymerase sigma-70 factor [Niabella sp.]|nr:RNA polymerase sigma-70 factor [Niabella sp.]
MNPYQSYSSNELFGLSKTDALAFRALYERYWQKLLTVAFLKIRDHDTAREIVQTVFVNLWNRKDTTELKHSFDTYIAAVLKYELLSWFAKSKKEAALKKELGAIGRPEDHTTTEWLAYEQLRDQIEKTVQQLPEKCRLVFQLSREQGYSEKEISRELQIAPKTVQAHLTKALKVLRSSLGQFFSLFI